jgi:hypothetical protein
MIGDGCVYRRCGCIVLTADTRTNPRELHQPGEKLQVTRSVLARNRFRHPLAQAC